MRLDYLQNQKVVIDVKYVWVYFKIKLEIEKFWEEN